MGSAHMGPESPEVELQHARARVIPSNKSFINLVQKLNFALSFLFKPRFMHDILSGVKWL